MFSSIAASSRVASTCCSRHWVARTGHLLGERLAVILLGLGSYVASGREDVAVLAHLLQWSAPAETGNVGVALTLTLSRGQRGIDSLAAPGVIGVSDTGDIVVRQLAVGAVDHPAHLARVDEQDFAGAVAMATALAILREEPEAGRYLRRVEELGRAARPCSRRDQPR